MIESRIQAGAAHRGVEEEEGVGICAGQPLQENGLRCS
jgi:hypothetical protein